MEEDDRFRSSQQREFYQLLLEWLYENGTDQENAAQRWSVPTWSAVKDWADRNGWSKSQYYRHIDNLGEAGIMTVTKQHTIEVPR